MPKISWARFSEEVSCLYLPPLRAKATHCAVRQILRELAEIGVKTTHDLTEPAVARWVLAHLDRSPARTESLLRTLAPLSKRCCKWGHCKYDPMADRPPRSWLRPDAHGPRPKVVRHRTAAEIRRLLDLLDAEAGTGSWEAGRLQALCYLYAYTGLRKVEGLMLELADIDLAGRVITIGPKPGWCPKTVASAAPVAIAEPLAAVLTSWMRRTGSKWVFPGKRLHGPWLHGCGGTKPLDQIAAAGRRAGIPGLTILGFRKTIGTLCKSLGISPLERKTLLRHTSVLTGEWYDEYDAELSRKIVGKIVYA